MASLVSQWLALDSVDHWPVAISMTEQLIGWSIWIAFTLGLTAVLYGVVR